MDIPEFKMCLVGNTGVGKTCISIRLVNNVFNQQQLSSSSASFYKKTITVDDKAMRLQIWDTAGQEMFRALAPMYYRSAGAIFVVFDVTRQKTFEDVKYWLGEIKNKANDNVIIYIIGNKNDLSDQRQVTDAEAEEFANEQNCKYYSCSAQSGDGILYIFEEVAKELSLAGEEAKKQLIINDETKRKRFCC